MPIPRTQARKISTGSEFDLVDTSYRDRITEFTLTQLKSKQKRAQRLADRERQRPGDEDGRRRLLFTEAAERYGDRIDQVISEQETRRAAPHHPERKGQLRATRTLEKNKSRRAEDWAALRPAKILQRRIASAKTIWGHIMNLGFMKQGRRDSRPSKGR